MKFQIKVGGAELFRFNLRHTYHSLSGLVGLALSIGALILAAITWDQNAGYQMAILIFIGCYYTVLHPWMLRTRAYSTAKNQEMFMEPMEYEFQEEGFFVRQKEAEAFYKWEDIARAISTKKDLILYTDKVHAHILPKAQMDGRQEQVISLLKEKLPAGRMR